jgi:serine/threonine-protein kinase
VREEPPARTAARPTARQEVGCATWVVGAAILLGLLGLIWLGFRLSPRLTGGDPPAPAPTEVVEAAAETEPTVAAPAPVVPPTAPPDVPLQLALPDLTGMTTDQARETLLARGLQMAIGEPVFSEQVPPDAVAEQDPPPGTPVYQGDTVYVKLSRGSARIDLAALDLTGRPADEAAATLRQLGLAVEQEEVPSSDVRAGRVVSTDPTGAVNVGDRVVVLISVGGLVQIPDGLTGQPVDQVVAQLERLGLRVGQQFPVNRQQIEREGIDLPSAGIEDGDVVKIRGRGIEPGNWVEPETRVDLEYYDASQDRS